MTSKLAEKFSPPPREDATPAKTPANRNARPQLTLHVRTRDGRQWAIPYAYFVEAHMPEDRATLTLRFTHRRVKVTGARLQPLFERLLDQTLAVLAEADSAFDEAAGSDPFIEKIETLAETEERV